MLMDDLNWNYDMNVTLASYRKNSMAVNRRDSYNKSKNYVNKSTLDYEPKIKLTINPFDFRNIREFNDFLNQRIINEVPDGLYFLRGHQFKVASRNKKGKSHRKLERGRWKLTRYRYLRYVYKFDVQEGHVVNVYARSKGKKSSRRRKGKSNFAMWQYFNLRENNKL